MGEKIKLSIIADAGAPTGFATVTHNIARYLQNSGDYEIQILGINYHGQPNQWSKEFNIWPAKLGGDFLGAKYAGPFFEQTKPEVILLFQDFWNIPLYLASLKHPHPGIVGYYPVDSPNMKGTYMLSLAACCKLGCYTNFGVRESVRAAKEGWEYVKSNALRNNIEVMSSFAITVRGGFDPKSGQAIGSGELTIQAKMLKEYTKAENYFVIPHGVDNSAFFPINVKDAREEFGFPQEWFMIGNINRNQSRKRLDLTIKGFAEFAKDKKDVRLVLHSVRDDGRGWDLGQLASYYGILDKLILTHEFFPGKAASVEQLNTLHNCLDINVNTGGGEGWGLNNFESAACRKPQIVPDWSATAEIWEGAAPLIRVVEVRHELSSINTAQATIDTKHFIQILNEMYENKNYREEVADKCFRVTQRKEYNWINVGKQFDEVLKDAVGKEPLSGKVALNASGTLKLKKERNPNVVPIPS